MMNQSTESRLDVLIRLAALQLLGDRSGADAIMVLSRAGLDNDLIAELVGTTPGAVRATTSRERRKSAPRKPA